MSSYLTDEQVEKIGELAVRTDLGSHMADVVIAAAYVTGQTPREMLANLAAGYKISDEQWVTVVAPELAFALGETP